MGACHPGRAGAPAVIRVSGAFKVAAGGMKRVEGSGGIGVIPPARRFHTGDMGGTCCMNPDPRRRSAQDVAIAPAPLHSGWQRRAGAEHANDRGAYGSRCGLGQERGVARAGVRPTGASNPTAHSVRLGRCQQARFAVPCPHRHSSELPASRRVFALSPPSGGKRRSFRFERIARAPSPHPPMA